MTSLINDFHFLRPEWLFACIPLILLTWWWRKMSHHAGDWSRVIAPELMFYLVEKEDALSDQSRQSPRKTLATWLLVGWFIMCLALAGPAWQKIPTPIHKQVRPLVILLDLSPSMLAEDIKPNRLTRARLKLIDLLNLRKEGTTALIAYSGSTHVVSPLTDDAATIVSLLPALHPNILPVSGSLTEAAIQLGLELIQQAGHSAGDLLLVTDGIAEQATNTIQKQLKKYPTVNLSILGVGTVEGAPIPKAKGGFVKSRAGTIVIAKLNEASMQKLANNHGGRYQRLYHTSQDIEYLAKPAQPFNQQDSERLDRTYDTWQDSGFWLVLCLIPLVLMGFRRHLIAGFLLTPLLFSSPDAQALSWDDLWLKKDQQGIQALNQGDTERASQLFKNPSWQGVAAYENMDYEQAILAFEQDQTASGYYNKGNALAKAGQLEAAIEAYLQALQKNPDMADAEHNRNLVEALLEEQKKQHSQEGANQDQNPQDSQKSSDSKDSAGNHNDQQQQQSSANTSSDTTEDSSGSESTPDTQDINENHTPMDQTTQGQEEPQTKEGESNSLAQSSLEETSESEKMTAEQQQTLEQWLRRIPDDPSGLMRRKFAYQARQRALESRQESLSSTPPQEERW